MSSALALAGLIALVFPVVPKLRKLSGGRMAAAQAGWVALTFAAIFWAWRNAPQFDF